jgi:hypothetical protein
MNRLREFSLFFSPVRIASAQLTMSPPFSLSGVASPLTNVTSFPWEPRRARWLHFIFQQYFIPLPPLSSQKWNIESIPPSLSTLLDQPDSHRQWYKNVALTLATFLTTQPRLHFTSSLIRQPRHQSSTWHPLSLSSHTHRPYTQRHSRW